jgi:phage gp46-like protein
MREESDVKVDAALIKKDGDQVYDIYIGEDGDLVPVYGFETTIIMQTLCERRADENEVPNAIKRRGWQGQECQTVPGFEHGSKLWQYYQSRSNTDTKNKIQDAVSDAFAWMVPEYLNALNVTCNLAPEGVIVAVEAVRKNKKIDKVYFRLWENT